jgi:hypothetical protein
MQKAEEQRCLHRVRRNTQHHPLAMMRRERYHLNRAVFDVIETFWAGQADGCGFENTSSAAKLMACCAIR